MKVYVDKLPKECFECPCFRNDIEFPCGLSDGTDDYFLDELDGGNCPLQTIADHDKEVRKQVCDEIRQEFEKHTFYWYEDEENVNKELYLDSDWVWEVLDQIEKGE